MSELPADGELSRVRGYAYLRTGKLEQAMEDLNRAIELDPASIRSYGWRAEVWGKMGEKRNALDDIEHAINKPAEERPRPSCAVASKAGQTVEKSRAAGEGTAGFEDRRGT